MAETYSVEAILSARDQNFTSTMNNALSTTQSLGAKLKSGIGFGTFMAIGSKAVGAVTNGIKSMTGSIGDAVARVDTLNNFPKIMKNLGYKTEDADKALKILDKGIDRLPTSMDQIASATQKIAPLTGNLGDAAKVSVALNNALLAGGKSTETQANAMEQFSQMLSAGKVDMQAWRSMLDAMPGQMNQLGQSLLGPKANANDLYDAMKSGEVSFDDFNNALLDLNKNGLTVGGKKLASFKEQALTATEGIGTAVANIKTAFVKGKANTINAIDEMLENNGLPKIGEMINNLKPLINGFFDNFTSKIKSLNLKEFGSQLGGVGAAIGLAFSATKISEFTSQFGGMAALISGKASGIAGAVTSKFAPLGKIVGNQMAIMNAKVSTAFDGLGGTITGKLGKAFSGVSGVMSKSIGAAGKVSEIALKALVPSVGIAAVIAGLGLLYTNYGNEINKILALVREKGPQIIQDFAASITSQLPVLMERGAVMVRGILNAITANIPAVLQAGVQIIQGLINGLVSAMPGLLSSAAQMISTLAIGIANALPNLILMGVQVISSLISGIAQQLPMLVQSAFTALTNFVQGFMQNLPQILQAGVSAVQSLVQGISQSIPQIVQGAISLMMQFFGGLIQNLPQILQAGIEIIMSLAGGLIQAIPQIIAAIPQIVSAIADGIMNTDWIKVGMDILEAIGKGITSGAGKIWDGIKGIFSGKGSGEATTASAKKNGEVYTQSTAASIKASSSSVTSATKTMATSAVKTINTNSKGIGKGFKANLSANLKGAGEPVNTATKAIGNSFKKTETTSKSAGQNVGKGYTSGMKQSFGNAGNAATNATNKVTATLKSGVSKARSVGYQISAGLASGIRSGESAVTASCNRMIAKLDEVIRKKAKVASPSRMTKKTGRFIALGLAVGMKAGMNNVKTSAAGLVHVINKALNKAAKRAPWKKNYEKAADTASTKFENKLTKRSNKAINRVNTTVNHVLNKAYKKSKKDSKSDSAKKYNEKLRKRYDKLGEVLKKKFEGKVAGALKKATNAANKRLAALGKTFQKKYDAIVAAKDNFVSKMRDYGSLFTEDKYGFVQLFDFNAEKAKLSKLKDLLKTVRDSGVSRNFLDQITSMDTDSQIKYLTLLTKKSEKEIKAYSKTFDAYWSKAGKVGKSIYAPYVTALNKQYTKQVAKITKQLKTQMKEIGNNAMKGLIAGLQDRKTKQALKKVAGSLASTIIKQIKKKLKIHSPSKVMEALGEFTGEGFAEGLEEVKRDVSNAMNDMVSIPMQMSPAFSGGIGMNGDYNYGAYFEGEIIVPVDLDGKEVAQVTAPFTEEILNKRQTRENRKVGRR